jgi:hypothetical protein
MKRILFSLSILLLLTMAACLSDDTTVDESLWTPTPSPVPSPTVTIQWFPPTDTPQPVDTQVVEPTVDQRPGLEDELFSDQFETPARWNLSVSALGSMALGQNDLTLAVSQPKGTLISLRDGPVLEDFDLKVTTEASLCKQSDYYGILIRATSYQDFYRFTIGCNGMVRLDRVKGGFTVPLVNWSASGQVPPGAPVTLTLGVWARGRDLRFFINDVYQFSVTDAVFPRGRVGVFARSLGTTAVTVSFSNLVVHSLGSGALPTSTPLPMPKSSVTPKRSPTP